MVIHIWPNDDWCLDGELSSMSHLSDDYRTIEVSDDWDYDRIDEFAYQLNRGLI